MITLRNIHKSYGDVEVLKGIDLSINQGEVVSIVGPSGAGKTTLLQIAGSLERPDKGSVLYRDVDLYKLGERELAHFRNANIGFVFQFHQLLPEFTLIENVALPAMIAGKSRAEALERATHLAEYMGLSSRVNHKPSQLSGGECQRAAVARALMNKPAVILADEPSGSLDSHNRAELHKLFFKLRDDIGQTFVIVTHDETLAADTDRKVYMRDGMIVDIVRQPQRKR